MTHSFPTRRSSDLLTLGLSLADCGVVQTALRLLQLASGELDAAALSALLCAGDWGEGEDDRLERGALDARLRRDGWLRLDLDRLLPLASPSLRARWRDRKSTRLNSSH